MEQAITYNSFRGALKGWFDKVCTNHAPLLVTRENGEDVIIISKSDYSALEETAFLLRSPRNATRILDAYNDVQHGTNVKNRVLID